MLLHPQQVSLTFGESVKIIPQVHVRFESASIIRFFCYLPVTYTTLSKIILQDLNSIQTKQTIIHPSLQHQLVKSDYTKTVFIVTMSIFTTQ